MKKVSKILLSLLMLCTLVTQVSAYSRDDNKDVKKTIAKMITSYALQMDNDYLDDLKEISAEDYDVWNNIMNYWDWIEETMVGNTIVPDNLPEKNHVFIVLGYALKEDGTMEDELVSRLETALSTIKEYPDNYILVTGGVEQNGYTEGQRMYEWLVENGVNKNKIIVETKAPDTAGNATNSFEMLYTDYTDIKSCSLITSQYHLKRGSILYYAESLLKAKELNTDPIEFIGEGNVGCVIDDKDSESLIIKAVSLFSVAHCMDVVVQTLVIIAAMVLFILIMIIIMIIGRFKKRKQRYEIG